MYCPGTTHIQPAGNCPATSVRLVEKHARMTHEEANWRLSLTQPSGYSNSFSSGNDGKVTRDDLHRKDWDGSSCGLVRLRHLSNCPSVPQGIIIGRQKEVTFERKLTQNLANSGGCYMRFASLPNVQCRAYGHCCNSSPWDSFLSERSSNSHHMHTACKILPRYPAQSQTTVGIYAEHPEANSRTGNPT